MSKQKKSGGIEKKGGNSALLKTFDGERRNFLKKLLISATYVTPVIITLSMRDLEAKEKRVKPTRRRK